MLVNEVPTDERSRLLTLVQELDAFLARAKQALDAEIRNYPTPIPRCDAQFNFLYEQRSRLASQLQAIERLRAEEATEQGCRCILDEFLRSPPYSDLPAEAALRSRAAAGDGHDDPAATPGH